MKSKWLYSKHPIVIDTDLATAIGLHEAIVLQQINYWLQKDKAKYIDGKKWVYNTFDNWQKDNFPFWSVRTIKRLFSSLESKGLLLIGNYNKMKFDRTKWYSIDYEKLDTTVELALGQNVTMAGEKMSQHKVKKCHKELGQNDPTYTREYTENTTENTRENICSSDDERKLTQSQVIKNEFEKLWKKYPKKQGKKAALNHYSNWRKKSKKHTYEYMSKKLDNYNSYLQMKNTPRQYILNGSTWFNGRFEDELDTNQYSSYIPPQPTDPFAGLNSADERLDKMNEMDKNDELPF